MWNPVLSLFFLSIYLHVEICHERIHSLHSALINENKSRAFAGERLFFSPLLYRLYNLVFLLYGLQIPSMGMKSVKSH